MGWWDSVNEHRAQIISEVQIHHFWKDIDPEMGLLAHMLVLLGNDAKHTKMWEGVCGCGWVDGLGAHTWVSKVAILTHCAQQKYTRLPFSTSLMAGVIFPHPLSMVKPITTFTFSIRCQEWSPELPALATTQPQGRLRLSVCYSSEEKLFA